MGGNANCGLLTRSQVGSLQVQDKEHTMIIGIPKEIKTKEFRVGLAPAGVRELTEAGHELLVEHNAGIGIGMSDDDYRAAGATILESADELFARSRLIIKVKEPQPEECQRLTPEHLLFTYLHLADGDFTELKHPFTVDDGNVMCAPADGRVGEVQQNVLTP
jgi:hypothetical protein